MPGESFIIIAIEREFGQEIGHKKTNDFDDKNFSWKDIHGDTHKLTRIKEKFKKIDSETEKIQLQDEQSQLHKELQIAKSTNLTLSKRIQELEMAKNQVSDQKKSFVSVLNLYSASLASLLSTMTFGISVVFVSLSNKAKNFHFGKQKGLWWQ